MTRIAIAAALAALGVAAFALPATAATPTYSGSVGPGFTISLAKKPTKPGLAKFTISDKATIHNWHLYFGSGSKLAKVFQVDKRGKALAKKQEATTTVPATGTVSFYVTLKKGTYTFLCDPHKSSMVGTFTIK